MSQNRLSCASMDVVSYCSDGTLPVETEFFKQQSYSFAVGLPLQAKPVILDRLLFTNTKLTSIGLPVTVFFDAALNEVTARSSLTAYLERLLNIADTKAQQIQLGDYLHRIHCIRELQRIVDEIYKDMLKISEDASFAVMLAFQYDLNNEGEPNNMLLTISGGKVQFFRSDSEGTQQYSLPSCQIVTSGSYAANMKNDIMLDKKTQYTSSLCLTQFSSKKIKFTVLNEHANALMTPNDLYSWSTPAKIQTSIGKQLDNSGHSKLRRPCYPLITQFSIPDETTSYKFSFIVQLRDYIDRRKQYAHRQNCADNMSKSYFWCLSKWVSGFDGQTKIMAAHKMIRLLQGEEMDFTPNEIKALRNSSIGRSKDDLGLGKIISKFEEMGVLPQAFVKQEQDMRNASCCFRAHIV